MSDTSRCWWGFTLPYGRSFLSFPGKKTARFKLTTCALVTWTTHHCLSLILLKSYHTGMSVHNSFYFFRQYDVSVSLWDLHIHRSYIKHRTSGHAVILDDWIPYVWSFRFPNSGPGKTLTRVAFCVINHNIKVKLRQHVFCYKTNLKLIIHPNVEEVKCDSFIVMEAGAYHRVSGSRQGPTHCRTCTHRNTHSVTLYGANQHIVRALGL